MPDAAQLRELAARMLALAMDAKDQQLLERLCVRASDYLDQAIALAHPPMLGRQPDETGWKVFPASPTPRLLSLKPRSSPGGPFHLCHRRPPTFRN
jgi:hypothetical protein